MVDVVEESLPELDVRSAAFAADPHRVLRDARAQGPLARSHRGIEVLSFDLCAAIFSNPDFETLGFEHFRAKGAPASLVSFVEHGVLLNVGKERHDRVRRVLSRAFSIRRVEEQRELMRSVGERLLAPIVAAGSCELVAEFTERYPMEILCLVLGVPPEDIPAFQRAAVDLHLMGAVPLAPGFPRLDEALQVLWAFVHELVETRKAERGDDFVSALITAQEEEARLSDEEVVWNLVNLLFAGQDTTRYQLASAVRELVCHAGLWDELADDPSMVPAALEEAMRLRPVSQFMVRQAAAPAEAGGFRFPAGRRIIVNLLAASRDATTFAAPDAFDLGREETYRLPFGWGVHYCLGHALARAEMCEGLALLTQRLVDVELGVARDAPPAAMLGGLESLPSSFSPREGPLSPRS